MGTIIESSSLCAGTLKKAASAFGPSSKKFTSITKALSEKRLRSTLSTPQVVSVTERNRSITQSINDRENRALRTVPSVVASSCFSVSSLFKSFNEPLQPVEGNTPDQFCWNCKIDFTLDGEVGNMHNLLTCSKCKSLRRVPKNINHFQLFGIPTTFRMDLKQLAQKYKSMQRILHPDRYCF